MSARKRGFTLLEVMIALFVFALLAVITARALQSSLRSERVYQHNANQLQQLQIAYILLKQDLSQAVNRPVTDEWGRKEPGFRAESFHDDTIRQSDEQVLLSFTRSGVLRLETKEPLRSHLLRVAYVLRDKTLLRRVWPVLDRVSSTPHYDRVLLTQVEQADWRYRDQVGHERNDWLGCTDVACQNGALPALVDVRLLLARRGHIQWLLICD